MGKYFPIFEYIKNEKGNENDSFKVKSREREPDPLVGCNVANFSLSFAVLKSTERQSHISDEWKELIETVFF